MNTRRLLRLMVATALGLACASTSLAQARFRLSSTPFQVRQSGVTETLGDIVLTLNSSGPETIPAGTNISLSIIPLAAVITNDPIFVNNNLIYSARPLFGPAVTPGPCTGLCEVSLALGILPNTVTISF